MHHEVQGRRYKVRHEKKRLNLGISIYESNFCAECGLDVNRRMALGQSLGVAG